MKSENEASGGDSFYNKISGKWEPTLTTKESTDAYNEQVRLREKKKAEDALRRAINRAKKLGLSIPTETPTDPGHTVEPSPKVEDEDSDNKS